jgi:hypothetical protein
MPQERRFFNKLPCYLQTDGNNRSSYIAEDVMFAPELAGFLSGWIGDISTLTTKDLTRLPQIIEGTTERQKYQLSLGGVLVDPDTGDRSGGAFYTDLLGHIDANGGLINNPNRLFETSFYTYSPPIDYDKHINFSRYYWTGDGNAEINGEYITKEAQGSQTIFYRLVSGVFTAVSATIADTAPTTPTTDDLWEDSTTTARIVYAYNGTTWKVLNYTILSDVPTTTTGHVTGAYIYVTRTGSTYNRPMMWKFSTGAGRWVAQAVVIGHQPNNPSDGMIWEDSTILQNRVFKIYSSGTFVNLPWTSSAGPSGTATDGTYVYDTRLLTAVDDGWSQSNWWRHDDDLSQVDRAALVSGDQAIRPIIEFWAGIEIATGDTRTARHDLPNFATYTYDLTTNQVIATTNTTTLFQYQVGTGIDDTVLTFPVVLNATGEFTFELTLETDTITGATGYRYFVDTFTGKSHSVWAKSTTKTAQTIDVNGLADVPASIGSNADHETITVITRSRLLKHMSGVIKAQTSFVGNEFGLNNYRWTSKDITVGATMIDCENSLLRVMGTLQNADLSIPTVIRRVARDYNRVMSKFNNRLILLWDALTISKPDDTLIGTATQTVDIILTELFVGKNSSFPYYYSDMGTFTETQIAAGVIGAISTTTTPIFIPPSPARVGASSVFRPTSFTDRDGVVKLRGHDGVIINAWGDERDSVWLELQTRFYTAVPAYYKDESTTFSARHSASNFYIGNHYGNSTPTVSTTVAQVIDDYANVVTPTAGMTVLDTGRAVLAYYDGVAFVTTDIQTDDKFFNVADSEYYIYNGFGVHLIDRFNNAFSFDYTHEEYSLILRREFERWAVFLELDFVTNSSYSATDPFTWNYRSAGVEGHYMGIYSRLYKTIRPHSHPWEILGYATQPDWWLASYVPTSTATDGTPRYANTHAMWTALQAGTYNPITPSTNIQYVMSAPIPVDAVGELIDPIAAGVVDESKLVPERKNDSWIYSDGAPIEQDFNNSVSYAYATALIGYLMKPSLFTETLWSELYVDIGDAGTYPIWNAPHIVHNTTLNRPALDVLPVHLELVSGVTTPRNGINSWISEYTQLLGNDITTSFGNTIRNTQISLGWKAAGYLNQNRTVVKTLSGLQIPFEDVHTILHRSTPTNEYFGSGVLVSREGTGYRVYGFDLFDPYFTIDIPVVPISGGQVELREDLTAIADQHVFTVTTFKLPQNNMSNDSAKLGILINGMKIKDQFITIDSATQFTIESVATIVAGDIITPVVLTSSSSPSTRVKQFQVNGTIFPYVDYGQGVTERVEYGRFYDTAPDVINFLLAYGRKLTSDGWVFDNEVSTGVTQDWLYGAKAFATWLLETSSPWASVAATNATEFFYSPFATSAKFESTFGQVLNVEAVQNGAYGIIDKNANPIDPNDVFTSRIENNITLTPDTGVNDIYGVRVLVAIDQHVSFFANTTKFNDIIYDPVTALVQPTLRVDAYRTTDWNGRLDADGFIISNGELLPNFEKQAKDFTKFYDRVNTLDDPTRRDLARELYGWYPNDVYHSSEYGQWVIPTTDNKVSMMSAIGADDRSQFDYHRGMIQSKGSIRPIIAFSRGTCIGRNNVVVTEDWAWRWCEFGDTRHDLVQVSVNKGDFVDRVQVLQFNVVDNVADNILQIPTFDRSTPDVGKWLIPPIEGQTDLAPYTMPTNITGVFNADATSMRVNIMDSLNNNTEVRLFHFDPTAGSNLNDGAAICELDYIDHADPARYTNGTGTLYSDGITWGSEQTGTLWWNKNRAIYKDYKALSPDYNQVAANWGKLSYFLSSITRTNDTVTVNTLDPLTQLAMVHGLTTGDKVTISGADQIDYNTEVTVTVTTTSQFTYVIQTLPDSPATGSITVQTGFIDVLEWIESPVTPDGWSNYTKTQTGAGAVSGTPYYDATDYNYVTDVVVSANGVSTTKYYFWIINNTGINSAKNLTASVIASKISSPSLNNTPWFGVIDSTHLVVFTGGSVVQDNYAVEIIQDQRVLDNHVEWLLVSEGDTFNDVPTAITDKLLDSLAGQDSIGTAVPSVKLSVNEKYGPDVFPPQTVFSDRTEALRIYVEAANKILAQKNLDTVRNIAITFPLTTENTYWSRAAYRLKSYESEPIFATVLNTTVRDTRLTAKQYVDNDLVDVLTSTNTDLWNPTTVTNTVYNLLSGAFSEVGIGNHTLAIILGSTSTATTIRETFIKVQALLTKTEHNELMFSLLYEMMRQHPEADWFMKTSYIAAQITSTTDTDGFVKPNENEAILANILENKPYRTKLRSAVFTYTVGETETVAVGLTETIEQKVTLMFDRLNCYLEDEAGWDRYAWDTETKGWDKPLWDWSGEGLTEWVSLGTQTGIFGTTTYAFTTVVDPSLYNYQVTVTQDGVTVNLSDINLSYTIAVEPTTLTLIFSSSLDATYTVKVEQSSSFYVGNTPVLPVDADSLFQPMTSTFKHHVARLITAGEQAPFAGMDSCATGGLPEERIPQSVDDSVVICVTNQYTSLYGGWSAAPWDTIGWDESPDNIGDRVFYITVGNESTIAAGVQLFTTSETVTSVSAQYVGRAQNYNVAQIDVNGVTLTAGTDYSFVTDAPWVTEFLTRGDITYAGDGITTTYDISNAVYGIDGVYINGILQTISTDYTVVGTNIVFVQPSATLVTTVAFPHAEGYVSIGETGFGTSHAADSINNQNGFLFVNSVLIDPTGYAANTTTGEFTPLVTPTVGDEILIFSTGNAVSNSTANFFSFDFVGDGATTAFVPNSSASDETTWVFVNGIYQVLGTDYVINTIGTVDFVGAPAIADAVHIRVVIPDPYSSFDNDHIVITASGTASDVLTGLADADPDKMMVFVDGVIQNSYAGINDFTLTNGNPDVINWAVTPTLGADITIRMIRTIAIGTSTAIGVTPSTNDVVVIKPSAPMSIGDTVDFYYDQFPVGSFMGLTINSVPTTYDIVNEILILDNAVYNGSISVSYSNTRRGPNPTSILVRMTNVVDRVETDHTLYDGTTGYELNRYIGLRVLNSTDGRIYIWDGTAWNDATITLIATDKVLVLQNQQIVEYNGVAFSTIFNTGDTHTTPPVLAYPSLGTGIVSGTYVLGQLATASVDFPEAFQVNQHLGAC